ncbi:MAG: ABC-F family ATP-binding cassette domain-containing protein [Candidatus Moranbacteria bacterium]|nr:ABC-F family ATP-binding cassette domain-containing protein [Candidatus Moranbacteria bacterium]MBP9801741.1 ABC-F family ATP-binding cassette domain-containing protein [Candidatus Moranbacteria bacterium]
MLTLRDIRKRYETRRILEGVSFSMGEGQKMALVGENGVGKSTLLKIIAGEESYDRGEMVKVNRILVGYLPQEALSESSEETFITYLERMSGVGEAGRHMARLEHSLEQPEKLAEYEEWQKTFERLGGYQFRQRARGILEGLALSHISEDCPLDQLSGGERRKTALAGVLLRGVDLLLLDEPTNNLDLPALLWLERYVTKTKAACLVASHDRQFLDTVVSRVIELDSLTKKATLYAGGWTEYAAMKAHQVRTYLEAYRAQETEKARVLASSEEKREWADIGSKQVMPDNDHMSQGYHRDRSERKLGTQAKTLTSRAKRLNKLDRPAVHDPILFSFPETEAPAPVLSATDVVFGYPVGFQSDPVTFSLSAGQRVGFFGLNGAGKSTLLRTLSGELAPLSGSVDRSEDIVIGNLMQEHEDINRAKTPAQIFERRFGEEAEAKLRILLRQFRFSIDLAETRVKYLSPGERVRVALALLVASGANTLFFDEPTNHLDLETIEAMEEALEDFSGTIVLVTHDRRFIEHMRLDVLFLLEAGSIEPLVNLEAYRERLMPNILRNLKRLDERIEKKF